MNNNYTIDDMAKDDNVFLKIAAVIGGAYIFAEIIRYFAEEKHYFSCPACHSNIILNQPKCNVCHTKLEWPTSNESINS